jgi:hypothetical protein
VYQALVEDLNASGGINGRQIDLTITEFDPTTTNSGEAECVELTEDEDVFLVAGLFIADSVLCPLEAHATAVVGGTQTAERQARAQAPWLTYLSDDELPVEVAQLFAEQGELDGTVGVFATTATQATAEDAVVPALEDEGVDVVEVGIMDAPTDDTTAIQASVGLIAERFEAAGVDTVVLVGAGGASWLQVLEGDPSYRPALRFLDIAAPAAFASSAATTDTSILDGSLAGGGYGPNQASFEEAEMQRCVDVLAEAGIETPAPEDFDPGDASNQPYQAAFQACADMALITAWLEAAGEDLNYGTLEAAIDGLEVTIPGDPTPRTYGPGNDGDGDPAAYVFEWDPSTQGFDLVED